MQPYCFCWLSFCLFVCLSFCSGNLWQPKEPNAFEKWCFEKSSHTVDNDHRRTNISPNVNFHFNLLPNKQSSFPLNSSGQDKSNDCQFQQINVAIILRFVKNIVFVFCKVYIWKWAPSGCFYCEYETIWRIKKRTWSIKSLTLAIFEDVNIQ